MVEGLEDGGRFGEVHDGSVGMEEDLEVDGNGGFAG